MLFRSIQNASEVIHERFLLYRSNAMLSGAAAESQAEAASKPISKSELVGDASCGEDSGEWIGVLCYLL